MLTRTMCLIFESDMVQEETVDGRSRAYYFVEVWNHLRCPSGRVKARYLYCRHGG